LKGIDEIEWFQMTELFEPIEYSVIIELSFRSVETFYPQFLMLWPFRILNFRSFSQTFWSHSNPSNSNNCLRKSFVDSQNRFRFARFC
jgi:hypothetical protein